MEEELRQSDRQVRSEDEVMTADSVGAFSEFKGILKGKVPNDTDKKAIREQRLLERMRKYDGLEQE